MSHTLLLASKAEYRYDLNLCANVPNFSEDGTILNIKQTFTNSKFTESRI